MSYEIDNDLRNAVESFHWSEQLTALPINNEDFISIINAISKKIIAASQLKPTLESLSGRSLSLVDVCYLIVQDKDIKSTGHVNLTRFQQFTNDEKNILTHVVKKLVEEYFIQMVESDLKKITLLFGIKPEESYAQELACKLSQLIALRSKYDIDKVPEAQRDYLLSVDQLIAAIIRRLEVMNSR